jgi:hypothetical protein
MDIGASAQPKRSTSKRKKTYVRGCGPKTIKSQRTQWVEEDMTMDPPDTTNNYTEKEVGQDYYIDVYMFIPFIL